MIISCPHCQNVIDTDDPASREDTVCPVCGSGIPMSSGSTADWKPLEGHRLGRFELIAAVGHGAFGTVYKARDPELDRTVAVKVPRSGRLADPQARERFAREARSAAQLRHPGIVPVLEVGQVGDTPFVVSEFVPGVTLSDWLSARRPTPTESARLIADLAEALQYAHDHGVIHRDVKPANVMIETVPDGDRPRLMDFGLARRDVGEVTLTQHGHVLGTPAYMSPEQARGESRAVDGRCDVYSLGVILYEMLTGGLPFRGTQRMLLHQVLHDDPRPPRGLNDQVPRDLETICLKALTKELAGRYQSAGELAGDLRRFLAHRPILARPIGRLGRARRWVRRNPDLAGSAALTATAVLATISVAVAFGTYEHRAAGELRRERDNTHTALKESELQRGRAELQSARLALGRGLNLCEAGEVGPGLVWLARSLELAPPDADDLRHAARRNLADWSRHLHTLRLVIPHPGPVTGVAVSPDGKTIVTGCADGTARFWNPDTGQPKAPHLLRHEPAVRAVAFSSDGRLVATAGLDGTARLWNPDTGAKVGTDLKIGSEPAHPGGVLAVAFSHDSRLVATGGADGTVRLWDTSTGRPYRDRQPLRHEGPVRGVAFSPDGKTLAAAGEAPDPKGGAVRLWEIETGNLAGQVRQRKTMTAVAFRPGGFRFVTGDADWAILQWNPDRLEPPAVVGGGDEILAIAFHPDGRRLAAGDAHRHTVVLWREIPREQLGSRRSARGVFGSTLEQLPWEQFGSSLPHRGAVNGVAFTPDGKAVVTGSDDGTARVWAVAPEAHFGGESRHRGGFLSALAFSPDGKTLLSSYRERKVQLWDARTALSLGPPIDHRAWWRPVFTPNGRLITIDPDGTVRSRDASTGKPDGPGWEGKVVLPVRQLVCGPDDRTVLVASSDPAGTLQFYDVAQGRLLMMRSHPGFERAGIDPTHQAFVTGSRDGTVFRWRGSAWESVGPKLKHSGPLGQLAVSPTDGVALVSGTDGVSRLYRLETGQPFGTPLVHQSQVWGATFSPDGRRVVTCSADRTARVWDAKTGEPVGVPLQHQGPVYEAFFSPDGKVVGTGSTDATARLWDAATGQPIGPALLHAHHVGAVAFDSTPGGKLATGSADGTIRLWAVPSPIEGDVERVVRWTEVITGLEIAEGDTIRRLDPNTWADRRRKLEGAAGPPVP